MQEGKRKLKARQRRGFWACLCLLLCISLAGCGKGQIVLTTGFGEDEVFRLEDSHCSRAEVLVYLTNLHAQYEKAFGSEIWEASSGEVSLRDSVKQTVLARLAKIKMMNIMALSYKLSLDTKEKQAAAKAAAVYYKSLSPEEIIAMGGVSEAQIRQMYEEYALAEKLYLKMVENVNTEVSDDEARIVTLHRLVLYRSSTDADGFHHTVAEEELISRITALRERILEGEDFDTLAYANSEEEELTVYLAKSQADAETEEVCFALAEGEVSREIVNEEGAFLYKCISAYDREQTQARKSELAAERQKEEFDKRYEEFAANKDCYLNEELWDSIRYEGGESVDTADFFDVYEIYFNNQDC